MINTEELKRKLYERLVPSGWSGVLKGFLLSQDFNRILEKLHEESELGKKVTPVIKQWFRFLEECPYDKLKCVLMLQDPYPNLSNVQRGKTVADGIPMSCSNDNVMQASLKFTLGEIKDTVYPDQEWVGPRDLSVWANQGVLLMNIALTTTVGKTGQHYQVWKPFVLYLLDYLSWHNPGLVYVYMGLKSKEYSKCTNDNCYKLFVTHPASAAYNNTEKWDGQRCFLKINELLEKNNKEKIIW